MCEYPPSKTPFCCGYVGGSSQWAGYHNGPDYYWQQHYQQQQHQYPHYLQSGQYLPLTSHQQNQLAKKPHVPSAIRMQRNRAEKSRRDKLNQYIHELAALVPMVAKSAKKIDKTSVLRLSATFLRMHQTISSGHLIQEIPNLPTHMKFCQIILKGMDGMLLVATAAGKIVFISSSVESLLGHQEIELLGQDLFNLTHPEDIECLKENFTPTAKETDAGPSSAAPHAGIISERRSFYLRLKHKAANKSEQPQFELVHIFGNLRIPPSYLWKNREAASKDVVLVAVVKPFKEKSVSEYSLLEANKDEWISRHLVDGRIIYSDHRISYSSGYFSEEVTGMTAFNFMHKDDVGWVLIGLRQMYVHGINGTSCYRLQMKTGDFMYIRTHGYLEINDSDSVKSFICFNSPVSKEEGEKLIKEMKDVIKDILKKEEEPGISAIAQNYLDLTEASTSSEPIPASEDPEHLKQAINLLISKLPEDALMPQPPPSPADERFDKVAIVSKVLPPVAVQSSQAGVTPPSLKMSPRSPSIPSPSPTQSRPSVLRLNTAVVDKKRCNSVDSNDSNVVAKRPRPTSVIVSEVSSATQLSVIRCNSPPSASDSSSSLNHFTSISLDNTKDHPKDDIIVSSEWFPVSPLGQSTEMLPFTDFQESFGSQLRGPNVEEEEALVGSLWTGGDMVKVEDEVTQSQIPIEDRLDRQGKHLTVIEEDLTLVSNSHSLIYRSTFSHLKTEHRKQEILKTLKQDQHSIQLPSSSGHCSRQLSSLSHQDIGV